MEFYLSFSYWIFQPFFWVVLGISIIIIDVFFVGGILLPFGISSLMIAAFRFSDQNMLLGDFLFFETWRDILLYYSLLSLLSLVVLRVFLKLGDKNKIDINDY
jgi:membrane protein implicated in regulation of membrane protease activity